MTAVLLAAPSSTVSAFLTIGAVVLFVILITLDKKGPRR